jgi:peptidylprolyl isomerase
MAKPHERAFALIAAILFLGTTVAFSVVVIWQITQDNKTAKPNTSSSQQSKATTNNTTTKPKEGKLEGTKLANFTPVPKVEKLEKIDIKEGTGEVVKPGAKVKAHYTGALAKDGTIFQSSHDTGDAVEFGLDQVIKGWTDGVPGMKVGGVRRLLIPADQAYGATERPGIPANSDLVFDIELQSVTQ